MLNFSIVLVIGLFSVEICPKNMIFLADCVSCLWHSYWNLYLFKAEEAQERSHTTSQLIKILFNFCPILVTAVDESMEGSIITHCKIIKLMLLVADFNKLDGVCISNLFYFFKIKVKRKN